MQGLMMDFQLTLPAILRRAETYFPQQEIVTRLPDRCFHRYTFADFGRAREAARRRAPGARPRAGDRVATLGWNHYQHLEAYFGIPCGGFVLHTLNLRLHPNDLAYIANHAGDRAVIVDRTLLPLLEQFRERTPDRARARRSRTPTRSSSPTADPAAYRDPELDENEALGDVLHDRHDRDAEGRALFASLDGAPHARPGAHCPLGFRVTAEDAMLPVVPMFHANAWGYPYTCAMVGAKLVFPGPHLDPSSLLEDFEQERVTVTAGVPTIWMGILQLLDDEPGRYDLSALRAMLVGGSAAPRAMIAGVQAAARPPGRAGVGHDRDVPARRPSRTTSAPSRDAGEEAQIDIVAQAGLAAPVRRAAGARRRRRNGAVGRRDDGRARGARALGRRRVLRHARAGGPLDARTAGSAPATSSAIDPRGYVKIQDRAKDVIKSGGEWISSVELENALMGHPAVAEAAVIAVPDEKWDERPLAVVVLREGAAASPEELREFLAPQFAKWWLPDRVEFVDEIPKTAVGKFRKTALREMFATPVSP